MTEIAARPQGGDTATMRRYAAAMGALAGATKCSRCGKREVATVFQHGQQWRAACKACQAERDRLWRQRLDALPRSSSRPLKTSGKSAGTLTGGAGRVAVRPAAPAAAPSRSPSMSRNRARLAAAETQLARMRGR